MPDTTYNPFKLYAQAYRGLSPNSWYLSLVMLINRSGTMVIPFMTIYCTQQLHFSITQAGYILALFGAGSIAGAFAGGKITDRFGFYEVQLAALLSGGLLFILLGFQKTFLTLGTGTFVLSVCNEAFRPANSAAIASYSSAENKTRSYSLNRLAVNLGWAVGGAAGGFLASVNYHLLFWVDGGTNILSALLLLKVIPRSSVAVLRMKRTERNVDQAGKSAYHDKIYLLFIILTVLFAACFFQLFTMQPVFYKTQWHLSERLIGSLMALNGVLIAVVEMVLIFNLEGKRHPLKYITTGVLVTGAGFLFLNLFPAALWVAVITVLIISAGEILSMPFMNAFWVERTNDSNRGQYAALYTIAWSVAQILAPALGSQVILHAGYAVLWWLIGIICCGVAAGFALLYKTVKASKPVADGSIHIS